MADAQLARADILVETSVRCGECHVKMVEEWKTSAHSRSLTSKLFAAARKQASDGKTCDSCHAPLTRFLPRGEPAVEEGVTCDVCHNIKAVEIGPERGVATITVGDMIKYGPLCDAKKHYFHEMGCSPLHETAVLCAACHQWTRNGLPIYTTYADWKAGPYGEAGKECQSCHMPGVRAEVAEGSPPRDNVPDHSFLGTKGTLRKQAAWLTVELADRDGKLEVAATVHNRGAGHYIPSGSPGRRLVVVARLVDGTGKELSKGETSFGRRLVDASGKLAPHHRATKVGEDARIAPKKKRRQTIALGAVAAGTVHVELRWRPIDHKLAAQLEVAPGPDQVLLATRLAIRAKGAKMVLPKSKTVKP